MRNEKLQNLKFTVKSFNISDVSNLEEIFTVSVAFEQNFRFFFYKDLANKMFLNEVFSPKVGIMKKKNGKKRS